MAQNLNMNVQHWQMAHKHGKSTKVNNKREYPALADGSQAP